MSILYTTLLGGSDSLKRAPAGPDRCVCFTDDPHLVAAGWEIMYWPAPKPRYESRMLKMSSHMLFPDEKWVVWADASMLIRDWDLLMADKGNHYVSCLRHPDRGNAYSEGLEMLSMETESEPRLLKRLLHRFKEEGFVSTSLSTAGLIVRRLSQNVINFNVLWRQCLDLYGIDDQLQMDYCLWKVGVTPHYLAGHYRDNPYMVYDAEDHKARRNPPYKRATI